jgi:RNA polymerase sigma-70 factor (ECF subfamily)
MCTPETIAALHKGNELAFAALFNEYHTKVFGYVLAKTNSRYLAEEVTQLTFIKLWQYRQHLRVDLPVSQQVFRIVKTTLIDALRSQQNRSALLHAVKTATTGEVVMPVSLEDKEKLQQVQSVITSMPAVRQQVFRLSRQEGFTMREIASILSISVKSVEKHIARAVRQIRHMLWFITFIILLSLF